MKYLYELTLNHRKLIEDKVSALCSQESLAACNYVNEDMKSNVIHMLFNAILRVFSSEDLINLKFTGRESMEDIVGNVNADTLRAFLLKGNSVKILILTLKHFRRSISELLLQNLKDTKELCRFYRMNENCFDSLEIFFYEYWEGFEKTHILFKKVFEATPFGVFVQEGQQMTYINPTVERICGYTKEEILEINIFDLMHHDFISEVTLNHAKWDTTGEGQRSIYECKIINKNGSEVWVEASVAEVRINNRICVIGLVTDITERKRIEELKLQAKENLELMNEMIENDKLKTEFFSNLSHELRTPLNVILGTLQLVDMYTNRCEDPVIDKTKKYYKIMRQNCYRLLRLVNNLIDINKLDAGYMHLNMNNYDIVSVVSKIASSVSDYIENMGICFSYRTEIDSMVIACDPDKIERIVLNLLSNAIKFTDQGGKIEVRLWEQDNSMRISIKDTGIGIPKEKQDLIFKRFIQIEKSLSRNTQGSGIGLSLVKSLVELHGGKIDMVSDIGQGSDFIIELPIKQTAVMESANRDSQYASNNKIEVINIEFADIYS